MTAIFSQENIVLGPDSLLASALEIFTNSYLCKECGRWITENYSYFGQRSFSCPNNCGFEAFPERLKQKHNGYPEYLGGENP